MELPQAPGVPSCSALLILPFVSLFREDRRIPRRMRALLENPAPDARIPYATVRTLLDAAVRLSGDEAIGLRAATQVRRGDVGALAYATLSAANVEQGLRVASRYIRLLNDTLRLSLTVAHGRAQMIFENSVAVPRPAADFQLAAVVLAQLQAWEALPEGGLDVYFEYGEPADLSVHRQVFGAARLLFGAPFSGFAFAASYLRSRLRTADPSLHALIRKHAELALSELPPVEGFSERVRQLLGAELSGGNPNAARIASLLQISESTLSRRLEREGTTFSALLDELRLRFATRFLADPHFDVGDIALLTGFSRVSAFYRAFRRWTGCTPLEYQRARGWQSWGNAPDAAGEPED
jgi:AraC-like DNA-binding protein